MDTGEEPARDDTVGMEPVAGPGRPRTVLEATAGESNVPVWRVKDEDTFIYIIGTVTLLRPDIDWETDLIKIVMSQADAVFLEADLFSRDAQRAMGVIVSETAELKNDRRLAGFYGKKEREKIDAALKTLDLDMEDFENFRPWFAAMQAENIAIVNAGGDLAGNMDVVIAREMLQQGTPLRYLETSAQRMAALAAGDDEQDAGFFADILQRVMLGEPYYADLVGAWYQGDLDRIAFLIEDRYKNSPRLKRRIVTERSLDWAQQLDRVLTDERGTFLVAVNIAHLVGEDSLQAKLEERGYTVEQVEEVSPR
ncbi:TraB/GumN family protein [Parvularcula lutaonensis]|uniref:TraB/GumN family protein n=1 Tax=Parvularcula lutaonensis TaxID=491923 RepID=A0ABV7MB41_9PROT|nr:TraB/GumN family protein [Parvularcula lutaonensis]GGY47152.1 hypothetical protein GCM10007148_15520 [Parvularcula lutaonensis]